MQLTTLVFTSFAVLVTAQSGANPLIPISGEVTAGQPLNIKWLPNTSGTVTLQLRWGNPGVLDAGTTIVSGAPNSGSYTYTTPTALKAGADYTIEILDDTDPTASNYSPPFSIASTGRGLSTLASSSATSSKTASSMTTETSSTTSASSSTTSTSASSTTSASSGASSSTSASSKTKTMSTASTASSVPRNVGGILRVGNMFAMVGAVAGLLGLL